MVSISRVGIEQVRREEEEEGRRRRGMWAAGRGKPKDCGARFKAKKFPWQKAEG